MKVEIKIDNERAAYDIVEIICLTKYLFGRGYNISDMSEHEKTTEITFSND